MMRFRIVMLARALCGFLRKNIVWSAVSAISSAIVAGVAVYGAFTVLLPQSQFRKVNIVAHSPSYADYDFAREAWEGLPKYEAPWEPATTIHSIGDLLTCPKRYKPVVAWHEITGSFPSIDILYTVNVEVADDEDIEIALRSRNRFRDGSYASPPGGYAYVDVIVRCQLRTAVLPFREEDP